MKRQPTLASLAVLALASPVLAQPSVTATDNGLVSPTGLRQYHLVADSDGDGFPGTFGIVTDANAHHSWAATGDTPTNDTIFLDDVLGGYHTGAGALDPVDPTRSEWDTHALYLESELLIATGFPVRDETVTTISEPTGLNVGSGRAGTGVFSVDGMAVIANSVTQTFFQVVVRPGESVQTTGYFIHNGQQFDYDITVDGYLEGDANVDGTVDFTDFLALQTSFGTSGIWTDGDFNGDGTVNFTDFLALQTNFGASEASAAEVAAFEAFAAANVPEPASLALLGLGGLAMLSRRARG